jgi:tRNA G46 methylase TrmB
MPYATFALRVADPNRLSAIARLHGVAVSAPNEASVLELGCGTGTNLIHIAERYPRSRCVGVDISERHIAEGHKVASGSGVSNVELRCGDIRNAALGHG